MAEKTKENGPRRVVLGSAKIAAKKEPPAVQAAATTKDDVQKSARKKAK